MKNPMPLWLPDHVDLRSTLPPVRNQGRRSTCVAFTVTTLHEHHRASGQWQNRPEDLSTETLYWRCKQIDGDYQPGTNFLSAAKALTPDRGQPKEAAWPYNHMQQDHDSKVYRPPANLSTHPMYSEKLRSLSRDNDVNVIKFELSERRLVGTGIWLYPSYDTETVAKSGVMPMPEPGERHLVGHAITLVGYDDHMESGMFIFRNSWGPRWGQQGYGFLPYVYLQDHFCSPAVVLK